MSTTQPFAQPRLLALAAAFAGIALLIWPHTASAQALTVPISETRPLSLAGSATDVLIGDPAIADVTVIDHHHLLIHGRGVGRTNLVVMDGAGRTLFSGAILVGAGDEDRVSLYRGAQQSDYSCAARCERVSGGSAAGGAGPSGPGAAVSAPLAQALSNPPSQ